MFQDIEHKIKGLAKIFASVGIVAAIVGIILIFCDDGFYAPLVLSGVALLVLGVVFFFSSWLVYGFGQLIENTRPNACGQREAQQTSAESTIVTSTGQKTAPLDNKQECLAQEFYCPQCKNPVHFGEPTCKTCGMQFNWSKQ